MDSGILLIAGGGLVTSVLSAVYWKRHRWLRILPLIYFLGVGMVVGLIVWDHRDIWKRLETVATFTAVGLGCWFAVWIQRR